MLMELGLVLREHGAGDAHGATVRGPGVRRRRLRQRRRYGTVELLELKPL